MLRRLDRPPEPGDELAAPFRDRPAPERAAGIAALAAGPVPGGGSSAWPRPGRVVVVLDVRTGLAEIGVALPGAGHPLALAVIAREECLGDDLMRALRTAANRCAEVLRSSS